MDDRGALGRADSARTPVDQLAGMQRWQELSRLEQDVIKQRIAVESIGPGRRRLDAEQLADAVTRWAEGYGRHSPFYDGPGGASADTLTAEVWVTLLPDARVTACAEVLVEDPWSA